MRPRLLTTLFVCFAFLFALPHSSHAEDKGKAQELLAEANVQMLKGDRLSKSRKLAKAMSAYEAALELFQEAYSNFESPMITYAIADAEQKLHRYLDALKHYESVLPEMDSPTAEYVKAVKSGISAVRSKLSGLKLTVEQEGATVIFDGETLGTTPLDLTHYFSDGRHTFSVSLDGYTPQEETIETKRGEVVSHNIDLEAVVVVVKKKEKKPVVVTTEPLNKTPMTVSFAVAGAFLVGATFTAIQAKARHDRYQDESVSDADREAARDRGKTYRLTTDIFLAGAALAAGYGTYYYYAKYKPLKEERALASLWVTPYASGESAGLAMGASF